MFFLLLCERIGSPRFCRGLADAVDEASKIGGLELVISHHETMGLSNYCLVKLTLPVNGVALDVYPHLTSSTILNPEVVNASDIVLISASSLKT